MIVFECKKCGSQKYEDKNGVFVCSYCGSSFIPDEKVKKAINANKEALNSPGIDLRSDIERLLEKCKKEPKNARRYANRILDIDPGNREALKYL